MKSGKQRKSELKARRLARAERDAARMPDRVAVNPEKLSPFNSYDSPDFLKRGYYLDKGFTCQGCGAREIYGIPTEMVV